MISLDFFPLFVMAVGMGSIMLSYWVAWAKWREREMSLQRKAFLAVIEATSTLFAVGAVGLAALLLFGMARVVTS